MAASVTSSALVQLGGILGQTRGIAGGAFAKTHWPWCDTAGLKWKQNRGLLLKLGTLRRGCAVQRSQQYSTAPQKNHGNFCEFSERTTSIACDGASWVVERLRLRRCMGEQHWFLARSGNRC